jgi:hypothetical protein
MLPSSIRIVEATLPYTLRPQRNDREKVIAAALEFVIHEYQDYREFGCGEMVISCADLWELIDELRDTVTIEEPSQDLTTDAQDAL